MIETCYCSPNMSYNRRCDFCQVKHELIQLLDNHCAEMTPAHFELLFSNYNIGYKGQHKILDALQMEFEDEHHR